MKAFATTSLLLMTFLVVSEVSGTLEVTIEGNITVVQAAYHIASRKPSHITGHCITVGNDFGCLKLLNLPYFDPYEVLKGKDFVGYIFVTITQSLGCDMTLMYAELRDIIKDLIIIEISVEDSLFLNNTLVRENRTSLDNVTIAFTTANPYRDFPLIRSSIEFIQICNVVSEVTLLATLIARIYDISREGITLNPSHMIFVAFMGSTLHSVEMFTDPWWSRGVLHVYNITVIEILCQMTSVFCLMFVGVYYVDSLENIGDSLLMRNKLVIYSIILVLMVLSTLAILLLRFSGGFAVFVVGVRVMAILMTSLYVMTAVIVVAVMLLILKRARKITSVKAKSRITGKHKSNPFVVRMMLVIPLVISGAMFMTASMVLDLESSYYYDTTNALTLTFRNLAMYLLNYSMFFLFFNLRALYKTEGITHKTFCCGTKKVKSSSLSTKG
jgi:hypothetical protein